MRFRFKLLKLIFLLNIIFISVYSEDSKVLEGKQSVLSNTDAEIIIEKQQLKELEKLKAKILKSKKNGEKLKIGVALSGGGAKGFAHIGVLRILEENNIKIDYISGTSMGSIVASLYAVGYTPDEIEVIVKTMDWDYRVSNEPYRKDIPLEEKLKSEKYVASLSYDNSFNFSLPRGLLTGEKSYLKLKELFWGIKNDKSFDDFTPKLRVVATNFNTGEAVTFDHGDLAKIVSASMAIPTIYDPVKINGEVYVDGMVSRNLPVEDLFSAGADIVIASDVGSPLEKSESYNLLTVTQKIVAYRGAEKTTEQREYATVIIDPDVKQFDPTDFGQFDYLIDEGEKAAKLKTSKLLQFSSAEKKITKRKKINTDKIFIRNIEITNSKKLTKAVIEENIGAKLPGYVTKRNLEGLMMRIYALPYIEKSYYSIDGDTLKIDVEENDLNTIRIGGNYNTDLGAKLAIGTDLKSLGKIGSITSLDLELGEYKSIDFGTSFSYGTKNKVGLNLTLGYEEDPIFLYKDRKLMAKAVEEGKHVGLSFTTQMFSQLDITFGSEYVNNKVNPIVGEKKYKTYLDKRNQYQKVHLNLLLDTRNKTSFATRGVYIEIKNDVGGVGNDKVEFYSQSGEMAGYIPITPKLSFNLTAQGGVIKGKNVPLEENFKLGGVRSDLEVGYISFYGYNTMRKLASEFIVGEAGFQYQVYKKIYLSLKANALTYSGIEDQTLIKDNSLLMKDYVFGYGASIGYDSFFGPLEMTLMNDSDSINDILLSVNIGYFF